MASVQADVKKRRPQQELVTILDHLDFSWYPSEIEYAAQLYKEGRSIWHMEKILRPLDKTQNARVEVVLLIMHMEIEGLIQPRKSGLYGEVN